MMATSPCLQTSFSQSPTSVPTAVDALIQAACIDCHGQNGDGGLDLRPTTLDLTDIRTFSTWVRVHDRIESGEMPPATEPRPDAALARAATESLAKELRDFNRAKQNERGRTILRRLTRTEFQNCVNDLLGIQSEIAGLIPSENTAGFDVLAAAQGLSPQHLRGYADATSQALELAIRLEPPPQAHAVERIDYREHPGIREHIDKVNEGKVIFGETGEGVVLFASAPWLTKFPKLHVDHQNRYRIRARARTVQTEQPAILSFHVGDYRRGSSDLAEAFDVLGGDWQDVATEVTVDGGQYLFVDVADLETPEGTKGIWEVGATDYRGAGVELAWVEVEGPLVERWPPQSTLDLLGSIELRILDHPRWDGVKQRNLQYEVVRGEDAQTQLRDLVDRLAPRVYSRPVPTEERDTIVRVGLEVLEADGSMDRAVRATAQEILTSPNFLFETAPVGRLDGYALARRLALFLWRSVPDEPLLRLAANDELLEPDRLAEQVERMLADPKSERLVEDVCQQWLRLSEIDATSPDMNLYPEYDILLQRAMLAETRLFLAHLIRENLSSDCLIDSDFTFVNRRLAEHYGIPGVVGQTMRRVSIPEGMPRGGLLCQASILKVTANGTTTSPVRRGAFVLSQLLGTPPAPPPPGIGAIEPDTRGTTTVRELLDKHRSDATCAQCHRSIDPPGFALEAFDVIGGYRERYRSQGVGDPVDTLLRGRKIWQYKWGPKVDASGQLPTGEIFNDIENFKALLIKQREVIAKHMISQWIAFATGANLEFADREELDRIYSACRAKQFGMRTMIHQVTQSSLFRNK